MATTFGKGTKVIFAAANRYDLQNLPGKKNVQIQNQTKNKSRNNGKKKNEMFSFSLFWYQRP
jgi:hypothetical protein